jgi:predicted transcriptional regulator
MNTPSSHQPAPRRTSVRMDARLDTMTRAKVDALATTFHRSRGAVLREVMQWGMTRQAMGEIVHGDVQGPTTHLVFVVEATVHQDVGKAARGAGMDVATWLRQMLRDITEADFPRSWQVAAQGTTRPQASPRVSRRSHDSRTYGKRFRLRLDAPTWQTLERFAHHFTQSHAAIIRQLIAQARLEDVPQSWQIAVDERRPERS